MDPREEAALHATEEWKCREMTNPIIVRDEDGHISLLPPGMTGTPAILPVTIRKPIKETTSEETTDVVSLSVPESVSNETKELETKVTKTNRRVHRVYRTKMFRDQYRKHKKKPTVS